MRGTYHIAGGLAMLGLGRACVTVGEVVGQSQAMIESGEPSWMSNALDTVSGVVQLGSTWIHQMFIPSDDQWLTSVAIGLPLFVIGTVLPDIDPIRLRVVLCPGGRCCARLSYVRMQPHL